MAEETVNLIRITNGWQSTLTVIGARYRYMFACPAGAVVGRGAVAEMERVIKLRPELTVVTVKHNGGRIMEVDFIARVSRNLIAIQGAYVYAGESNGQAILWTVQEVYEVKVPSADVPRYDNGFVDGVSFWLNPFDNRMSQKLQDAATGVVDKAATAGGSIVGNTLASLVKPLLIPAALGFLAYTVIRQVRV